ncbi:MAG: GDP-mannose 4,6-dehydratase, partial [Planctomycetaceae bacterium]
PADPQALLGNPAKARQQLGWQPSMSLEDLMRMMVDEDCRAVQAARV